MFLSSAAKRGTDPLNFASAIARLARLAVHAPAEVVQAHAAKTLEMMLDTEVTASVAASGEVVIELDDPGAASGIETRVFIDQIADLLSAVMRAERERRTLRSTDPLTGLSTRDDLLAAAAESLPSCGPEAPVALLYVEIERFREVREAFDHMMGDEVLREVAGRLRKTIGDGGLVARLEGDRFAVLLGQVDGRRGAIAIARELLRAFKAPLDLAGREMFVCLGIGIAVATDEQATAAGLLRDATIAAHKSRLAGPCNFEVFEREMRRDGLESFQMEQDLRSALTRGEIQVVYQPVISLLHGRLAAAEALARWEHPRLGTIPPGRFIPIAEATGLIDVIGEFVLNEACAQMARWLADPATTLTAVTVNISGRQLADPGLPAIVAAALHRTGIEPHNLSLEITESVLISETKSPIATLQRLKDLGVQIVLDDFGTGYSSLHCLNSLPLDAIKIDRSFITGLTEIDENCHVLASVTALGKALGFHVLAEGVETIEQARIVHALGCFAVQGFLYARPMSPARLSTMLREGPLAEAAFGPGPSMQVTPGAASPPEGDEGADLVTLGEAAEALGLSASTLRRWADRGEIGSVRTSGGHRRFPVSEVQRMMSEVRRETRAKLRDIAPPSEPQPLVGAVLTERWRELVRGVTRSLYEPGASGFFASVSAEEHLERWVSELETACHTGRYEGVVEATQRFGRQARLASASTAERTLFVERFGELAVRMLRERNAEHAALVAARRLFVSTRNAMLDDETPAWRSASAVGAAA